MNWLQETKLEISLDDFQKLINEIYIYNENLIFFSSSFNKSLTNTCQKFYKSKAKLVTERLFSDAQQKAKRFEKYKKIKNENEMKECTFHPIKCKL